MTSNILPQGWTFAEEETTEKVAPSLPEGWTLDSKSPKKSEKRELPGDKTSLLRSWVRSIPKGALKEISKELRKTPGLSKEQRNLLHENKLLASDSESLDFFEKLLPTKKDFVSRALERGGKNFPYFLIGGRLPSALVGSVGSGLLGEGIKEAGGSETSQAIGEVVGGGIPSLGRRIIPTRAQRNWVNFGRRMGMSEEAIAPLIQSERKQRWLSKLTPKRGRTQRALANSQRELGQVYSLLENRPEALQIMTPQQANEFAQDVFKVTRGMPVDVRTAARNDAFELAKDGFSAKNLMNFYHDINHLYNSGYKQLGQLKGSIERAMTRISPSLGRDFRMTNELYSRYATMRTRLRPTLVGDLMTAGRSLRLILGVSTGNFPLLAETIGETAARQVGREMLINPRFQNLGRQMVNSLNNNKIGVAKKIADLMADQIEKKNKKAAEELRKADFKKIKEEEKK